MTQGAGVLRSRQSLERTAAELARIREEAGDKTVEPGTEAWETTNLLLVSQVLVAAALRREETRGCHWREDHPGRDDERWRRHLVVTLGADRTLAVAATDRRPSRPSPSPARQRGIPLSHRPQGEPREHQRRPSPAPDRPVRPGDRGADGGRRLR
ncbi:hypothetical protein [Streptomyces cinnamoneus]|uniref:hypothetical protein n=1 Tax=Streptomyces cinnamoneus TaxID=53446 RepID=UPI003B9684D2